MSYIGRLCRAGLVAGLCALPMLACGSDTISLLPAVSGSGGQAQGAAGTQAGEGEHTDRGGSEGSAGNAHGGSSGGVAGMTNGGGVATGGAQGCLGNGCAGFFNVGGFPSIGGAGCFSAYDFCTPCGPADQCPNGLHCNNSPTAPSALKNKCVRCTRNEECEGGKDARCDSTTGRCGMPCDAEQRCPDGRVCDVAQDICAQCVGPTDCERRGTGQNFCHGRRCVECEVSDDCDPHEPFCFDYRCIECVRDIDCPNDKFCDNNGHCQ